jgi:hypothetical protein
MVFLVIADGWLTNILIKYGIAHEWNPFLQSLAGKGGLVLAKIFGAVVCAFVLWDIYKHWPKLALISAYSLTAVYAGIVLWNLTLLVGAIV